MRLPGGLEMPHLAVDARTADDLEQLVDGREQPGSLVTDVGGVGALEPAGDLAQRDQLCGAGVAARRVDQDDPTPSAPSAISSANTWHIESSSASVAGRSW